MGEEAAQRRDRATPSHNPQILRMRVRARAHVCSVVSASLREQERGERKGERGRERETEKRDGRERRGEERDRERHKRTCGQKVIQTHMYTRVASRTREAPAPSESTRSRIGSAAFVRTPRR